MLPGWACHQPCLNVLYFYFSFFVWFIILHNLRRLLAKNSSHQKSRCRLLDVCCSQTSIGALSRNFFVDLKRLRKYDNQNIHKCLESIFEKIMNKVITTYTSTSRALLYLHLTGKSRFETRSYTTDQPLLALVATFYLLYVSVIIFFIIIDNHNSKLKISSEYIINICLFKQETNSHLESLNKRSRICVTQTP